MELAEMQKQVSCQNTYKEENRKRETYELWNYGNVSPLD